VVNGGEVRETELLERITAIFQRTWKSELVVPNGDDGAVISLAGKNLVASTDVAVEGIHFRMDWSSYFEVGRKITAANLADICAMGGWPEFLLVTVILPSEHLDGVIDIARGIAAEADLVGAQVIGGDLSNGSELAISITALGSVGKAICRTGAKVGDRIVISKLPGASAAGLHLLKSEVNSRSKMMESAIAAHKVPEIEYERYKSAYPYLNCATDTSDGLLTDASHLARASGVRFELDGDVLKTSELAQIDSNRYLEWVLTGGEDHLLLGTTEKHELPGFTVIGRVTTGDGVYLDGKRMDESGYSHRWN
jgi:thiamine-monophosphate kinase